MTGCDSCLAAPDLAGGCADWLPDTNSGDFDAVMLQYQQQRIERVRTARRLLLNVDGTLTTGGRYTTAGLHALCHVLGEGVAAVVSQVGGVALLDSQARDRRTVGAKNRLASAIVSDVAGQQAATRILNELIRLPRKGRLGDLALLQQADTKNICWIGRPAFAGRPYLVVLDAVRKWLEVAKSEEYRRVGAFFDANYMLLHYSRPQDYFELDTPEGRRSYRTGLAVSNVRGTTRDVSVGLFLCDCTEGVTAVSPPIFSTNRCPPPQFAGHLFSGLQSAVELVNAFPNLELWRDRLIDLQTATLYASGTGGGSAKSAIFTALRRLKLWTKEVLRVQEAMQRAAGARSATSAVTSWDMFTALIRESELVFGYRRRILRRAAFLVLSENMVSGKGCM